jgi:hypothetical protein
VQVLDFAQVDSWRAQRTGFPEVVLGAGKSAEQIAAIMRQLAQHEQLVMATRVTPEVHCLPEFVSHAKPGNWVQATAWRRPCHGGLRACWTCKAIETDCHVCAGLLSGAAAPAGGAVQCARRHPHFQRLREQETAAPARLLFSCELWVMMFSGSRDTPETRSRYLRRCCHESNAMPVDGHRIVSRPISEYCTVPLQPIIGWCICT